METQTNKIAQLKSTIDYTPYGLYYCPATRMFYNLEQIFIKCLPLTIVFKFGDEYSTKGYVFDNEAAWNNTFMSQRVLLKVSDDRFYYKAFRLCLSSCLDFANYNG